jgi:hypothetical protein
VVSKLASIPGPNGPEVKGRDVMNLLLFCLNSLLLINLQETPVAAFDDMGKLLLGGTVAAVVVAVGVTLVRFRMRDKKPQTSSFISISSTEKEQPVNGQ